MKRQSKHICFSEKNMLVNRVCQFIFPFNWCRFLEEYIVVSQYFLLQYYNTYCIMKNIKQDKNYNKNFEVIYINEK